MIQSRLTVALQFRVMVAKVPFRHLVIIGFFTLQPPLVLPRGEPERPELRELIFTPSPRRAELELASSIHVTGSRCADPVSASEGREEGNTAEWLHGGREPKGAVIGSAPE